MTKFEKKNNKVTNISKLIELKYYYTELDE
jgi:hypothetical protein